LNNTPIQGFDTKILQGPGRSALSQPNYAENSMTPFNLSSDYFFSS